MVRITLIITVLLLALASIGIACSAPASATPEPPTATPDVEATVEARVKSEREAEATILAVLQTEFPSPTPIPTPTTDIAATVQAAIAEALPTATPTPVPTATPTPTPVPTPTPTWQQWLGQEFSNLTCTDPQHELRYENPKTTPPYSADFYCLPPQPTATPTPTPRPTATPRPWPTPTPRPARIPQDRSSRLAGITVLITTSEGRGTGFFAVTEAEGRYYVFTNEHVVEDADTVDVYWHLARETLTANVLRSSAYLDIAILDLQPSDFDHYPNGWGGFSYGGNNYDKGDEVWIAGYPSDMGNPFGKAPVVRDGTIYQKSLQGNYRDITSLLEHSVKTAPGSSGSPIVNSSDQIIAINYGRHAEAERIGLGVPLWAIYRWLETGDDSSQQPTPTPQPTSIPQDRGSRLAGITVLITTSEGRGTGFFAVTEAEGRYYVFTNEHVVEDADTVDVYWHLARETLTANVLRSSAYLDIAILDLQPSDFDRYPNGWGGFSYGGDNYDKGDEVWIAGYPSDMGNPFGKPPVVRDGTIYQKSLQGNYRDITSLLEHSVKTAPGSSGSPIVNSSDEIIAINMGGDTEAERIGLGVPLWAIYRWLETGDDSTQRDDILQQSDGAYWAVLTWEENGEWLSNLTPEGNYCITQIWERDLGDGRKSYRWLDLCGNGLQGYIGDDGEIYFEHIGRTYYAPRVMLAERPR